MAAQFEVYEDSKGSFQWHLKLDSGQYIASSPNGQSYGSRDEAKRGIRSVQAEAVAAGVVDKPRRTVPVKTPVGPAQKTAAEVKQQQDELKRTAAKHKPKIVP